MNKLHEERKNPISGSLKRLAACKTVETRIEARLFMEGGGVAAARYIPVYSSVLLAWLSVAGQMTQTGFEFSGICSYA